MVYVRLQEALPPYIYEYNKKRHMEYITGKYFLNQVILTLPAPERGCQTVGLYPPARMLILQSDPAFRAQMPQKRTC